MFTRQFLFFLDIARNIEYYFWTTLDSKEILLHHLLQYELNRLASLKDSVKLTPLEIS